MEFEDNGPNVQSTENVTTPSTSPNDDMARTTALFGQGLNIHHTQQVDNEEDIPDEDVSEGENHDEDDDEDINNRTPLAYHALSNYNPERYDPDNRFATIVDHLVHNAFAHAIEGLVILKQMNNHLAVTRAQGCLDTINNIFKDEFGSDVNALRNVTVLRGERGSTVQLDDTIHFVDL